MMSETTIIPVAGGKGGVGKTLLTANLAMALAQLGHPTIVVDLDLGNSNLNSFLGLPNQFPGVGDFLRIGSKPLQDFLVETNIENLQLIPGDGRMPFMANITYYQKQRLIRHLMDLSSRYVLLDLGAGCTFNTLDFFAIASSGIIVTTPEYPSIMSMLAFLKNHLLRILERSVSKEPGAFEIIHDMFIQPVTGPQTTIASLRDRVKGVNPDVAAKIDASCRQIRPRLIYNMGEHPSDLEMLGTIDQTLKQVLALEADHFGFVFFDPSVREAIRKRTPLILYNGEGRVAESIRHIAERIVRFWDQPVPNSANLLLDHTRKVFETQSE